MNPIFNAGAAAGAANGSPLKHRKTKVTKHRWKLFRLKRKAKRAARRREREIARLKRG